MAMAITLHNHIRIETDQKPIIPNIEFKKLCEEIKAGNIAAYSEIKEKYSMVPFQHSLVQQLINEKNLPSIL